MTRQDDEERQERIRRKAYELWEAAGRPDGQSEVHWDKATELVAIEDNQALATKPVSDVKPTGPTGEPVEPVEALENTGEYPTMTDQGEQLNPARRRSA
jgi:hypothetical protein